MQKLTTWTLLFAAAPAWAHQGHGAISIHLHWWEYGLLAALVAAVFVYSRRK